MCSLSVHQNPTTLMATATQLVHINTIAARENLNISLSTLRRAVQLLRKTLPACHFDKGYCDRGFSLEAYLVLERYFQLRAMGMGTHRAAEYLRIEFLKTNTGA